MPHYESTAVFKPVVQLDEVETKTHEEDEETLYKMCVLCQQRDAVVNWLMKGSMAGDGVVGCSCDSDPP